MVLWYRVNGYGGKTHNRSLVRLNIIRLERLLPNIPSMDLVFFQAALSIVVSLFYLACLFLVVKRGKIDETSIRLLLVYIAISIAWSLLLTSDQFILGGFLPSEWGLRISHYSIIFLTIILLVITFNKFNGSGTRLWVFFGTGWLGLYLLLDGNLISLERLFNQDQNLGIAQRSLSTIVLISGWVILIGEITRFLTKLYHQSSQKLFKNQISYWTLGLLCFVIGDGLIFAEFVTVGSILHWIGTMIITSVLLFDNLPEIRQLEQYILYYLITSVITASVLILSMYIALPIFQEIGRENPTFAGAILILSTASLLSLIWILSARLVSRYIPLISNDPDRILHRYSQSISDILDAERLGQAAIQLICEEFDIQHGYLFLVDFDMKEESSVYILKSTNTGSKGKPLPGILAASSLFVNQLNNKRRILKQSDIDNYQRLQTISQNDLEWLRSLDTDIYIPIHTREEWVGLFALGPKNSDNPYFNNEIMLLNIIADQTAVALNNARLVESLMRLNNDFRRAYKALEQSNAHLRRLNLMLENLERTKSDFIHIASYELRSPISMIQGYNKLLLEDPKITEDTLHNKLSKGIHSGLIHLEEIIDGMKDIASMDTRTLQLQVESISVNALALMSIDMFTDILNERNLTIKVENLFDLPQVEADPVALQKALYHLIANAIKYSPNGETIIVSGQNLAPGEMGFTSGGVQVSVSDHGISIKPENLELIFTKFFPRGDHVEKNNREGMDFKERGPGLGLAIAKGIVEAHRGKIWAESPESSERKHEGNTFHFALPMNYYDYPSPVPITQYESA